MSQNCTPNRARESCNICCFLFYTLLSTKKKSFHHSKRKLIFSFEARKILGVNNGKIPSQAHEENFSTETTPKQQLQINQLRLGRVMNQG